MAIGSFWFSLNTIQEGAFSTVLRHLHFFSWVVSTRHPFFGKSKGESPFGGQLCLEPCGTSPKKGAFVGGSTHTPHVLGRGCLNTGKLGWCLEYQVEAGAPPILGTLVYMFVSALMRACFASRFEVCVRVCGDRASLCEGCHCFLLQSASLSRTCRSFLLKEASQPGFLVRNTPCQQTPTPPPTLLPPQPPPNPPTLQPPQPLQPAFQVNPLTFWSTGLRAHGR